MNFTMSDNRTPLNPGDVIEVNAHKKFVIDKYVACGGFALMYIAHEENAGGSRYVALKELFPRNPDNALVQRMEDGKILIWNPFAIDSASGDEEVLEALKQYFVREVELTQKAGVVYANNGQVEQQNNLDVLNVEGPFTDTKGNVYLAVDTYMGESLREFIERGFVKDSDGKVHSNQFLLEIIDILIETTLRLSSLHDMASMYHLDLSPDNIYLAQVAGRTRHQPYIIDYGSAYDRDNPDEQVDHRYTWNSFSAPEVIKLAELKSGYELFVDESSDTFSIASILFYAATGSTFTSEMRFYDDQWQEQIRQAYSLGIPSFSRELSFANDLIAFFKHGLAVNQNDRYRSAKELLCALQQIKASYQSYGNLLPLVERDELMSYLVLQKHPLYEYKGDDGNIHVLCLGSGCFIKRMILSLISTGQMIGSHLYIHIVSKEANSALRAELCADAPLLQEYSNLMGACNPQNEYVTFSFEAVENVLQEDSCRAIVEKYSLAHYYLISLGKNRQNTDAANLYAKTISESHVCKRKTIINFYCSEDAANSGLTLSGTPSFSSNVEIDAFADDLSSYSYAIRTLGLRTLRLSHLYNKLGNPAATLASTAESLLKDSYTQRSSCASALHIGYKVASIGLGLNQTSNPEEIICAYRKAASGELAGKLLELEHRRWMMYMIADQYTFPTESELMQYGFELVDERFNGAWKCTAKKLHPCLVPCKADGITLTQAHWDDIFGKEDLIKIKEAIAATDFDALDKISLQLRLLSLKKCKRILASFRLEHLFDYIAEKLSDWTADNCDSDEDRDQANRLQKELADSRQIILTAAHNLTYSGDDGRLSRLQVSFADVSINIENEIQQMMQFLRVFMEYAAQKDYKAFDATIINNLMWVLYSGEDFDLLNLHSNQTVNNVASALIIEPRNIIFFGTDNCPEWKTFLQKHKFGGSIDFVNCEHTKVTAIEAQLEHLINSCTRKCVIDITGAKEEMIVAAQKVAEKNGKVSIICVKENGEIENVHNFPAAVAYTLSPCLSAGDVFTLHGATEFVHDYNYMDHLEEYVPKLWELYREFQGDWEGITAFFAHPRCGGTGIWVNNVRVDANTRWEPYYRNNIPNEKWTLLQLESVFTKLEEAGFIRNVVFGTDLSGKTVKFEYPAQSDDPKTDYIRKVFTNFFGLKIPVATSPFICNIVHSPENGFNIDIKSESVIDCFSKEEDYSDKRCRDGAHQKRYRYDKIEPVLKRMEQMGLITKLVFNYSPLPLRFDIKFNYVDVAVKKCLTIAGNVLELYVWYNAKKLHVFDDCAANFAFQWREGVRNELDVILTKGLTTIVISCKTAKFNKEHLYEIKYLTDKFSVNSKPVIIYSSKLAVEEGTLSANLKPVKERAKAMDVYLIDLNELDVPLGEKLVRIANGIDLP